MRSSCILQACHARLDQVPIVFGTLVFEYQEMLKNIGDDHGHINIIIDSIERRWKNGDQDVYIAAIILHPLLKTAPFAKIPLVAPANIWILIQRLWKRFYKADAPTEIFSELDEYLNNKNMYAALSEWSEQIRRNAEIKVSRRILYFSSP